MRFRFIGFVCRIILRLIHCEGRERGREGREKNRSRHACKGVERDEKIILRKSESQHCIFMICKWTLVTFAYITSMGDRTSPLIGQWAHSQLFHWSFSQSVMGWERRVEIAVHNKPWRNTIFRNKYTSTSTWNHAADLHMRTVKYRLTLSLHWASVGCYGRKVLTKYN